MKVGAGHLETHSGPMYAGKSSALKARLVHYQGKGMKVIYLNHGLDSRGGEVVFSTHTQDKNLPSSIVCKRITSLLEEDVSEFDVIGLDEAQFFPVDLVSTVLHWVNDLKKIVIVAGLDLTAEMKRWRDVHLEAGHPPDRVSDVVDLSAHAEAAYKHCADCDFCLKEGHIVPAPFTVRFTPGNVVSIGSHENYCASCRFHHR